MIDKTIPQDEDWEEYGITEEIATSYHASLSSHIRYVQEACILVGGIPTHQMYTHDRSKYMSEEFPHYARQYHGDKGDPEGYARAWLHHIHHNPHHWNHWLFADGYAPKGSNIKNGALPMPENYVREMVADWMGAEMTYNGRWDMTEWLTKNLRLIKIHAETQVVLQGVLVELGYDSRLVTVFWE